MTVLRNLRMLTRYSAWANQRMFDGVAALPAGEATAKRTTLFGNMVNTLNHNYVIDLIWKGHLTGVAHGFTKRITDVEPSLEELRGNQTALDAWYIDYADGLTEPLSEEVVQFEYVDGGSGAISRGDMLLHIVNHKSYHRGFVAEMICQAKVRPPVMDLPVFLREVEPSW
ncbi:MAG: DinB family protein [Hylemonella sp.]|jgi:uncharacterized damage-inducible protein DinB